MRTMNRKKNTIIIGVLCAVLVIMGVGYAILSQTLTISGTSNVTGSWNVFIDSITPVTTGTGTSVSTEIGDKSLSATFEAELLKPGDSVEYTVVVKNTGTIDAKLVSVTPTIINGHEYVAFSNSLSTVNTSVIVKAGHELSFTVNVSFADTASIDRGEGEEISPTYKIQLNFEQTKDDATDDDILINNPVEQIRVLASGDISKTASDHVTWQYLSTGELKITGTGATKVLNISVSSETPVTNLEVGQQIIGQILTNDGYTEEQIYGSGNKSVYNGSLLADMVKTILYDEEYFKEFALESLSLTFTDWNSFTTLLVSNEMITEEQKTFLLSYVDRIPKITRITIDEGITELNMGFNKLGYAGSVSMPSTLINIGSQAFKDNRITSLILNEGLLHIYTEAFSINKLTTIVLPSTITNIDTEAFNGNDLTSLTLKNTPTIAPSAFKCNPELTSANITLTNSTFDVSTLDFTCSSED